MVWRRRTVWLTATASSVILLGLVLAQVDWSAARTLVTDIAYVWIAAGIALLLIEGLITAARLWLLAQPAATYGACLTTTAWYVLLLIGLPARLGEVAGIALIVRYMRQRSGAAAASLLFQRLFDMVLLILLLAGVTTLVVAGPGLLPLLLAIGGLIVILLALMVFLEDCLSLIARPLLRRRREKWPRRLLRLTLQARMMRRHHMDRRRSVKLAALTLMKWIANLGAICCVVLAVVPALSAFTAFGVGIVYNLSAVIPIQTIGGFGISEAVLMGSFRWLGYSLAVGAPIAIAIRLALVSAPILFWLVVIAARRRQPVPSKLVT